MSEKHIVLSVLFFQDPSLPGTWVAQGLERDIAASGSDIAQAKVAFERTLSGYLHLATKHHMEPLEHLRPAPSIFWDVWSRTVQSSVQAERMPSIHAFMMPVVTYDALPA